MPPEHMPYRNLVKPVAVFVRPFPAGAAGPDVLAVKRALIAAGKGRGVTDANNSLGAGAVKQLKAFQTMCKLQPTGAYNVATHRFLAPYFDPYGCSLLAKEAVTLAAQKKHAGPAATRAAYVKTLEWGVAHHALFNYVEGRPMPLTSEKADFEAGKSEPIDTDCSGWVTGAAYLTPGCPDPNGLHFNGEGFTGTILAFCDHVPLADCQPGDLIVYGPLPSGYHVSAAVAKQPNGDWQTVSNGHQGCPEYCLHSAMAASQAAAGHAGFTVCRFLVAA